MAWEPMNMFFGLDLLAFLNKFSTEEACRLYIMKMRYPSGEITCVRCGKPALRSGGKDSRWRCTDHYNCDYKFHATTGTRLGGRNMSLASLRQWLLLIYLLTNLRDGMYAYDVSRILGVSDTVAKKMLKILKEVDQKRVKGVN